MERLEVSTVVHLPADEVYDFLLDFPGYASYSKHLRTVAADGDGGPGTDYRLRFEWWLLTYTAHSRVTSVDPPESIEWTVTRDIDADGRWAIEPLADPPADATEASRVRLIATYDPDSVGPGLVDLPALVSWDWLVDRVADLIQAEGERVVERIVEDLEGERRDVDLQVSV